MNSLALTSIDHRAALALLPPLIKGYLRVGARFGEGAVIDHQFGTTDVLVILPVKSIQARYINHFGHEAERFAA
jgi:putative hemolysin